jgi:hypothetical protein
MPAGLAGIQYAAAALASTFGALVLLLACCVVGSSLARPWRPAAPVPQLALRRAASTSSAHRSI